MSVDSANVLQQSHTDFMKEEQPTDLCNEDKETKARIRDFNHLAQSLKNEINESLSGFIDRVNLQHNASTNSEDNECPYDGTQSLQLIPMHLRKAKLMFFSTRYPNSTLLKSYFPDIRFNENNTAQIIKWFGNFREYYYIQIEMCAHQLLAEGITSREEIFVSLDSEVYKNLNQHYNRSNNIEPPPSFIRVIQETLREFFDAIKMGKDEEPSWKKTIYTVINRMDDQIPEYFKDPNFLEKLESSQ